MKTGIILAGGQARRFNGLVKELLPISEKQSVLDSSVSHLLTWGASTIRVVTNEFKLPLHKSFFAQERYANLDVQYHVQVAGEMWDALRLALYHATEQNMMLMADTVISCDHFDKLVDSDFALGVFQTDTPDRYSIIHEGRVITKPQQFKAEPGFYLGTFHAWGAIGFSDKLAKAWLDHELENAKPFNHYDDAFNWAIQHFDAVGVFPIEEYYDIGTFSRYTDYLRREYFE